MDKSLLGITSRVVHVRLGRSQMVTLAATAAQDFTRLNLGQRPVLSAQVRSALVNISRS